MTEKPLFSLGQTGGIRTASLVHDLGDRAIPQEDLPNPTPLSKSEISAIREHPQVAHHILNDSQFTCPIAEMIPQRQEWTDCLGDPKDLPGEEPCAGERSILAFSRDVTTSGIAVGAGISRFLGVQPDVCGCAMHGEFHG